MNKDKAWLLDIAESMRLALSHMNGASFEAFVGDRAKTDAVHRRLEIIGEATKRLSPDFRDAHGDIPWTKMAGMRDILIHGYDRIEPEDVYDAVTGVIPLLIPKIDALILTLPDPD
jgi:uncharacterized protein with HEPN domain